MNQSDKIKQSKLIASAQNKGTKISWGAVKALCSEQKNQMKLNKVLKSHINKSEQKQTLRTAKASELL